LIGKDTPRELLEIVKMNGGGNFTASVYLREDGFFILFNTPFLERIAAAGKAERFAELLNAKFKEALKDATEESKLSARTKFERASEDRMPCLQVGD
jgi:hypothetical protein